MKTLHFTLRNLLPAFLLLFFTSNLHAATFTWVGGTGNWHDAANWDLLDIPTADDGVYILSGEVTITQGAEANYIFMDGGDLHLDSEGTLYVAPTIGWHGPWSHSDGIVISQSSTLYNSGSIRVYGDPQYINGIPDLIRNYGTVHNRGSIAVAGPDYGGIRVFDGAELNNRGYITTNYVSIGITVQANGSLYNSGDLVLLGSTYAIALNPGTNAVNTNAGSIKLRSSSLFSGVFHNYGDIEASGFATILMHVTGEFQNQNGATLDIEADYGTALFIYGDAEFRNRSEMNVTSNSYYDVAILNTGFLVNHQTGVMTLEAYWDFYNIQSGEVRNYGKLTLNSTDPSAISIHNENVFSNRPKGTLEVNNIIENEAGAFFNNQGHMFAYNESVVHWIDGNFNNTGALGDVHDNISGINNTSIRVRPLQDTVQVGVPVANALDVGGTGTVTVEGWYTSSGGSTIAGSYDAVNNTFTPNANAVGLTEVWVKIRINTGGKTKRHRVKIPGGVQLNGGGSSSRIAGGTQSSNVVKAFNVYPNPATKWINIDWEEQMPQTKVTLSLTNAAGQQVYSTIADPSEGKTQLQLPAALSTGMYTLNAISEGRLLLTQMIQIHR